MPRGFGQLSHLWVRQNSHQENRTRWQCWILIKLISYWLKHPSLSNIQGGKQNPKSPHMSPVRHLKPSTIGKRINVHIKSTSGGTVRTWRSEGLGASLVSVRINMWQDSSSFYWQVCWLEVEPLMSCLQLLLLHRKEKFYPRYKGNFAFKQHDGAVSDCIIMSEWTPTTP